MRPTAPAAALAALLFAAAAARAETLRVPEQYATIQAAVDAAQPGDVVEVGSGIYPGQVSLSGRTGITIRGRGGPILQPGPGEAGFSVSDSGGIAIEGFAIEGGDRGVDASISVLLLSRLTVSGTTDAGIALDECDGSVVTRCRVEGAGSHGILDSDSDGLVVERCVVEGSAGDAIRLSPGSPGTDGARVERNRITGGVVGVRSVGIGSLIARNRIREVSDIAIDVVDGSASANTVVESNRVATQGAVGISLVAHLGAVRGNRLAACAIFCIGDAIDVEGNRISAGAVFGIYVDGPAATVASNRLRDAQVFGIRVFDDGPEIRGNAVAGSGGEGISVYANDAVLHRNRVAGAASFGIILDGTGATVTGNRARGSGQADLADTQSQGVNTYEGNRFGTVSFNTPL